MDITLLLLVWLTFATWLTLHVVLAIAVGQQKGALRGLLGLLVCPLLPWFGLSIGAVKRSLAWVVLAITYALLLFFASR